MDDEPEQVEVERAEREVQDVAGPCRLERTVTACMAVPTVAPVESTAVPVTLPTAAGAPPLFATRSTVYVPVNVPVPPSASVNVPVTGTGTFAGLGAAVAVAASAAARKHECRQHWRPSSFKPVRRPRLVEFGWF
jgi:hypothetical protein